MDISGMTARPMKPVAPFTPQGGNVENRQPPPEPAPPAQAGVSKPVAFEAATMTALLVAQEA